MGLLERHPPWRAGWAPDAVGLCTGRYLCGRARSAGLPLAIHEAAALGKSAGQGLALFAEALQQQALKGRSLGEEFRLPGYVQDVFVGQIFQAGGEW